MRQKRNAYTIGKSSTRWWKEADYWRYLGVRWIWAWFRIASRTNTTQLNSIALMPRAKLTVSLYDKNIIRSLSIKKKTSVAWVHERTIPTKQPSLVGEVIGSFCGQRCHVASVTDPYGRILGFLDRGCNSTLLSTSYGQVKYIRT
jgi:hypothetical protein